MIEKPVLKLISGQEIEAFTAERVENVLYEAGKIQVIVERAMKSCYPTQLRSGHPEVIHDANDAYGYTEAGMRFTATAIEVSMMRRVLEWPLHIEDLAKRKAVHMRMLIRPENDRHVFSFGAIARKLHINAKTASRWFDDGVQAITKGLNDEWR